ncbi:DNA replication complex GINS protein PSF3 isoform X2 [Leptonychotes weddellii]|uniref:DNA replication complex GINS protein PSF3 n=1 Tax=Leptonychotes weddellii TaxID=9713 RepID=A0A7F8QRH2_LEPWE|nr:DNA replication complex GINS protein PSF3 isoform X2 [Leptonychotes weddellii]
MSEAYFRVESGALGPEENFLSLDDILMSHEKLPVRTETPMPRLGAFFLERSGGAETDHAIPQGSKLELPLWLTKGLFDNKRRILSVELPKIYQQGWRTVFSADANVVDLHKLGPHFYGFGSQLLHFDNPENADISQCLLQGFEEHEMGCLWRPAQGRLWNHGGCWGDWKPKETRRCQNSENHEKNEKTQASLVCSGLSSRTARFPGARLGDNSHQGNLGLRA